MNRHKWALWAATTVIFASLIFERHSVGIAAFVAYLAFLYIDQPMSVTGGNTDR
ncbi:hypothetical protein GCM10009682_46170 [Luedemannella flava]|uniref:Uncharacterized protein n=1 Tax=Luedemannella flava TaxID=349316 RepID=A0ABN2MDS5_9ACTN